MAGRASSSITSSADLPVLYRMLSYFADTINKKPKK